MPVNPSAIFLPFLFFLFVGATIILPVANAQQEVSDITCPEGFLEGYTCRNQQTLDDIVEMHQNAIRLIHIRRAAENLQNLPMPTEFAGLFSYLRWHRELYGLDDIDPTKLPRRGSKVNGEAPRTERQRAPIPELPPHGTPVPLSEQDMPPEGATTTPEPDSALSSKAPPEKPSSSERSPKEEENGQGADTGPAGKKGTISRASPPNAEKGVDGGEKHRIVEKHDKDSDDGNIRPPGSADKERAPEKERKRILIPGLPPHVPSVPSPEPDMPSEGMITGYEPDKTSPSENPQEKLSPSEKPPGGEENGQDTDIGPAEMGEAASRTPTNAEKDAGGSEEHRTTRKQDKGTRPEPMEIDDIDMRHGKLQGYRVPPGSPEHRNVLGVLDPDNESAQQEMEIYRIDSCVIGQDRGESKLPADNVTDCGPSGRLLAGFKLGKYKIEKDSFMPKHRSLLAGLERSLLGYKLPEDETVLILGYADHIPYKDDYDPPRIDKYKRCALRAGELQFDEIEVTGDGRSANDDGNRQLALARAREIQNWLTDKGVLKSDRVCLKASPIRPEIDSVSDGEPLDRAVAVYILRPKARTTEANHE
uniref:OmpA family protein n=1 Tax=Candidatus Kentrum sp. LFY TaxID=2126342 RepID=A0A450WSF5_9GAMM|nr:MAG: hypothetical protein BECKLFY1418C_GA0070996_106524 [Candidatus Kentron sp. LFY]